MSSRSGPSRTSPRHSLGPFLPRAMMTVPRLEIDRFISISPELAAQWFIGQDLFRSGRHTHRSLIFRRAGLGLPRPLQAAPASRACSTRGTLGGSAHPTRKGFAGRSAQESGKHSLANPTRCESVSNPVRSAESISSFIGLKLMGMRNIFRFHQRVRYSLDGLMIRMSGCFLLGEF